MSLMSLLCSEPFSDSLLHSEGKKRKAEVLTLICSAPHDLFLASLLELSSCHPPLLTWLHSLLPPAVSQMCQTLLQPQRLHWHFPLLECSSPSYLHDCRSHFSLLTNHLLFTVFKIIPPTLHHSVSSLPCFAFVLGTFHLMYCILYFIVYCLSSSGLNLPIKNVHSMR